MNPSDNNSFGMPNTAGGQGMMAQPVAPRDTGDILLPGSEKKGGKKWLYVVLGVAVAVILVVFGAWMIAKGDGGSESGNGNTAGANVVQSFNEYANYIIYGRTSSDAISEDTVLDFTPYFEGLIGDASKLAEYLKKAEDEYAGFAEVYYANGHNYNLGTIAGYFQGYPNVLIGNSISVSEDEYLDEYLQAVNDLSNFETTIINKANELGCVNNGIIDTECYVPSEDEVKQLGDYTVAEQNALANLKVMAMRTLTQVYNELYDINDNSAEVAE